MSSADAAIYQIRRDGWVHSSWHVRYLDDVISGLYPNVVGWWAFVRPAVGDFAQTYPSQTWYVPSLALLVATVTCSKRSKCRYCGREWAWLLRVDGWSFLESGECVCLIMAVKCAPDLTFSCPLKFIVYINICTHCTCMSRHWCTSQTAFFIVHKLCGQCSIPFNKDFISPLVTHNLRHLRNSNCYPMLHIIMLHSISKFPSCVLVPLFYLNFLFHNEI